MPYPDSTRILTQFESKSSRAKGLAFHSTRPWVLVSLHSSTIQLWDYRMGTLVDRFEDHDGPVRGVDFHKTQPLFVSCGDDYKIKVWSLQTRKCLFTLVGHLDYVRTVFFHHELPWIISCSDDQTIRIWNWQNRQEIACLTGHSHYIMSAQFHPSEDLVVSACLDQTVRVWDISGLRKKHSAGGGVSAGGAGSSMSFEEQMMMAARNSGGPGGPGGHPQQGGQDMFGNQDCIVKYVLEGHDGGVNWATFHPTLPLIVSGGDDRVLKIWRMSDTKAWEVDTCRGHTNNILSCCFHPYQDVIVSVSEDKTIRTWDLHKRTLIKQFKRENDKFWALTAHPNINLFAAGHESGIMVFKMERERPASTIDGNSLLYMSKEKQLKLFDFNSEQDSMPLVSLKKYGSQYSPIRSISYNPAARAVLLLTKDKDQFNYNLVHLPKDAASGGIEATEEIGGNAAQAVFVARNRFAVFNKNAQTIDIRDLSNTTTRTIKLPKQVKDIVVVPGSSGQLLLLGPSHVYLLDVAQKTIVAELAVSGVKYVNWSKDGKHVALLTKHTVTIASATTLKFISSLHETIRIKSACWDDNGVLLYTTLNHLKYTLLNGDSGIIKTLENTLYIVRVKDRRVYCLNRAGEVEVVRIDPTEYRFKRALVNKNFSEVLRIIKSSNLVGQSIISYLQKKGYPEIALQFVQDPKVKFDLAIECGNLTEALEQAQILDEPSYWTLLGKEALSQGNFRIVELVYQKQQLFDKLSFVYVLAGDSPKLQKMAAIAAHRGDGASMLQNSLYTGSVESRVDLFRSAGLLSHAYAAAKHGGLDDVAADILAEAGVEEGDVKMTLGEGLKPATPAVQQPLGDWPLKQTSLSFFEQALLGQVEVDEGEDDDDDEEDGVRAVTSDMVDLDLEDDDDDGDGDAGWDMGDDLDVDDVEVAPVAPSTPSSKGHKKNASVNLAATSSEPENWIRASSVAAVHVAAGSFETAAQLLNRQIGIVDFEPLRQRFMTVYEASKLYYKSNADLPPLELFVRGALNDDTSLPLVPGFDSLSSDVKAAFRLIRANDVPAAISAFRQILYTVAVMLVPTHDSVDECEKIIDICREYIGAFSIELERRRIAEEDPKRNLELAAYFTKFKLQPAHAGLPWQVAMTQAFKLKNYASASVYAEKFLETNPAPAQAEKARKVKHRADAQPLDAIELDFDVTANFAICPRSLKPIYPGDASEKDPFTGAEYLPKHKGQLDVIGGISAIGAPSTGLKLI
ncbi:YALI0E19767p [Yarrowia lipolytica CLIB122]|uniref:Coatomer subunit alpha n=1 Tax=Yarrowia lipolytica (strain CLIB 122 / E 150) TaxID=284591 RepID=Q6C5A1_YARLI|nr:YALI0E19767p [Yarrowia lipolytica CLIB122]CAG79756.1 YALI0E19767p [Yarrowia lipolytica CLIB122]|eukprot:XP_504161.1 YALI0E19767p [Yarrowia lipolytica CLIB122]